MISDSKQILERFSSTVILRPGLSQEQIAEFQAQLSSLFRRGPL
jgi:hypothetical protein